jgi:hypothetical protein
MTTTTEARSKPRRATVSTSVSSSADELRFKVRRSSRLPRLFYEPSKHKFYDDGKHKKEIKLLIPGLTPSRLRFTIGKLNYVFDIN